MQKESVQRHLNWIKIVNECSIANVSPPLPFPLRPASLTACCSRARRQCKKSYGMIAKRPAGVPARRMKSATPQGHRIPLPLVCFKPATKKYGIALYNQENIRKFASGVK